MIYNEKLMDLEADHAEEVKEYPDDSTRAIFVTLTLQTCRQLSGINVIVIYGAKLAQGFAPNLTSSLSIIINTEKLIFAVITAFMVVNVGRKTMLERGYFVLFLSLMGLATGYYWSGNTSNTWAHPLIMTSFLGFIISYEFSIGSLLNPYTSEIVQPSVNSLGIMMKSIS